MADLKLKSFYDQATYTLTYVVFDEKSRDAIIIDPVMDYDPHSSTISYESVEKVLNFIKEKELNLSTILETHAHADHLSGAEEIKKRLPQVKTAIGEKITIVQKTFKSIFNLPELSTNGEQFDYLLKDGQKINFGSISVKVISTPGHTPACSSYLIEDMLFTGDTMFMPDGGTGRCDFPKGSAEDLYHSIHEKIYSLPDETRIFVGHDYQPGGRDLRYETTVGDSKENNIQLKQKTTKDEFLEFRNKRDATLNAPKLLLQSVQVNIDGGALPKAEDNKTAYLKMPLTIKGK